MCLFFGYLGLDYLYGKKVSLAGTPNASQLIEKGQYWRITNNIMFMSALHITNDTCRMYVKVINEFKPSYIHGYPSSIYLLATHVKNDSYCR